jgi:hypothetical protein
MGKALMKGKLESNRTTIESLDGPSTSNNSSEKEDVKTISIFLPSEKGR